MNTFLCLISKNGKSRDQWYGPGLGGGGDAFIKKHRPT